jgi:hypothetical protein
LTRDADFATDIGIDPLAGPRSTVQTAQFTPSEICFPCSGVLLSVHHDDGARRPAPGLLFTTLAFRFALHGFTRPVCRRRRQLQLEFALLPGYYSALLFARRLIGPLGSYNRRFIS